MIVDVGSLNKRITLVRPSSEQDPNSQAGDAMPDQVVAIVWAQIKPMSGSELFRAQQFVDQANIQITIRYRPDVDSSMKAVYQDRSFNILATLNELEQNVQLNLLCSEIQ